MRDKTKARPRRVLRIVGAVVAVLLGVPAVGIAGLLIWDGDFQTDPQRELLPGVQIDLQTASTPLGPVEYDLYGAQGPVVLSLHGGLGGADQGRLFASWLQDDGYRILSPSRPGYLRTPLDSGRTTEQQADLLAALLDELGIDQVGVLAISAAGPVGYTFAARHPERVWGLVAVGGISRQKPGEATSSAARQAFLDTIGQKVARLTGKLALGTIVAGTLDETSTFSDEQKAQRSAYILDMPQIRAFFTAMFDTTFPYPDRMPGTRNDAQQTRGARPLPLERITAPTLVVHGKQDADVPFEEGMYAAERIPGAQPYWMEQDDHLGFWLSPAATTAQDVARAFLREYAPRQ